MLLNGWLAHFEMPQKGAECLLIRSVVLPVGEVADVTVLQPCGPACVAFQDGIIQANRKEHIGAPLDLLVERGIDLSLDPATPDGIVGEKKQERVRPMNGLFNPA